MNAGSTYTISGTQFNGLTQGAAYGDDWQSATNYPLVRITNTATGHVFYARTHDHSSMGVATGSTPVHTHFDVPAEVGLARKRRAHGEGGELNHLDRMDLGFHERVIAGYRALISAEPARWRVIDASRPPAAVQTALRALIASPVS